MGLEILSQYLNKQKKLSIQNDPSENARRRRARDQAKEVVEEVNNRKNDYFQNVSDFYSEHLQKIDTIQVNPSGKYFVTTSLHEVKIWQLHPN